ncbi:protein DETOXIFICATION 16-like isoform X2 [Amaranthus tricolor]|uniref:protein DETOXIFICATION 16-like isoform X2 n=1 Tax=Amaranthus tricolor TaxID=29722 RepID=UPI00258DDDC3|nr:protein DETOXIFICATION 16-like isoform X2 [Amaranthus tricolor]
MEKQENSSTILPLLSKPLTESEVWNEFQVYVEEAKRQLWLACPLILVGLLTFSLHIISLMMVGRLGELALSAASMATSFAYVTGFALLLGMASALETICGQSYGAGQYHMVGIHTQRAMVTLTLISIPIGLIWFNTETILMALGQNHEIAAEAAPYTRFSSASFQGILGFLRLAIPSAVMVCLEMWSFEMIVLLSGLLPNPALETSVLSISLNTTSLVWVIPEGFSGAVSTRVSNELGAGNPQAAKLAVYIVLCMTVYESFLVGLLLILIRNAWGYAYSNEMEVVRYLAAMMPLLSLTNLLDGLACVLSGTARGCGWQKIGAYINLGSFYLVGLPAAILLAFFMHIGGKGLWLGIICALILQVLALFAITVKTNWELQVEKAMQRVSESKLLPELVL